MFTRRGGNESLLYISLNRVFPSLKRPPAEVINSLAIISGPDRRVARHSVSMQPTRRAEFQKSESKGKRKGFRRLVVRLKSMSIIINYTVIND